jgi:ketosteroid isomerase-like protein
MQASMTSSTAEDRDVVLTVTRLFTEAFNARDLATARGLMSDDIEFRGPNGSELRGEQAAREVFDAAQRFDVVIVRTGPEEIRHDDAVTRVLVPIRELVGGEELFRTAELQLRGLRVAGFEPWATD